MKRHLRAATSSRSAAMLVSLVLMVALPVTTVAAEPAVEALNGLRDQYSPIRSLHLKASVLITIHRPGGLGIGTGGASVGSGTFEYWAEGNRYRIRSTSDPRLELTQDFDIAYDGTQFQLFDLGKSTLTVRRDDLRQLPIALPNPFFLPLDFLSQDNDDCLLCRLKLQHLAGGSLWQDKLSSASLVSSAADRPGPPIYDVPGGSIGGVPFRHRIYLGKDGDSLNRIDRFTSDDKLMLRIDLGAYEVFRGSEAVSKLPRHISVTTYNYRGDGKPMLESNFVIDQLAVNPTLTVQDFILSRDEPEYVYESDQGAFLKRPEP